MKQSSFNQHGSREQYDLEAYLNRFDAQVARVQTTTSLVLPLLLIGLAILVGYVCIACVR